jgi:hypothetical protein
MKSDVKVKCPLVKLERGSDVLTVEFNTIASPEVVSENSRNICRETSTNWNFMNMHKIAIKNLRDPKLDKKWIMVTVVINDTSPNDPLPLRNKTRCRIYVNGLLELDRYVDGGFGLASGHSLLRRNNGMLYVSPSITTTPYEFSIPGYTNNAKMSTQISTNKTIGGTPSNLPDNAVMMADLTYYNYGLDITTIKSLFQKGFTNVFTETIPEPVTQVAVRTADKYEPSGIKEFGYLNG